MIADRGEALGRLARCAQLNELFDRSLGVRTARPCTPAEVVPSHPRSYRRKVLILFNEGRTSDILTVLSLREALKGPPAPPPRCQSGYVDCVGVHSPRVRGSPGCCLRR